jgi:hypothetical protein
MLPGSTRFALRLSPILASGFAGEHLVSQMTLFAMTVK